MSLLPQRAIDVRVASIFSERRPADARAWFVRLTSCRSDVELKLFALQPRVVDGAARTPTEVRPNANASIARNRRGRRVSAGAASGGLVAVSGVTNIDGLVPCGRPEGSPVLSDRMRASEAGPRRDGPDLGGARVPDSPPLCDAGHRTGANSSGPHQTGTSR